MLSPPFVKDIIATENMDEFINLELPLLLSLESSFSSFFQFHQLFKTYDYWKNAQ